jgi:hypothetical protein
VPIPLFIFYELLTRIHQIDPSIGTYVSHRYNTTGAVVITSNRTLRIKKSILNRQFKDPELVTVAELALILQAPAAKKRKVAATPIGEVS